LADSNSVLRYAGVTRNAERSVGGYDIDWGTWRATSQPILYQDREDGSDSDLLYNTSLLFGVVDEVTPSFSGSRRFKASEHFLASAGAKGSSVSDVDGALDINLDTADVAGDIIISVNTRDGVDLWNGAVTGTLRQQDGRISGMSIHRGSSYI